MIGWHHWLNRHEFEQIWGHSEGWGAWSTAVHGVAKSLTGLSDWTTTSPGCTQSLRCAICALWFSAPYTLDLLELTPKEDVLFIIGDWNTKAASQEIPGVTGKFGPQVQNEAGQRLIVFCQENALVVANTLFQQHKRIYKHITRWSVPKSDWLYSLHSKMEKL